LSYQNYWCDDVRKIIGNSKNVCSSINSHRDNRGSSIFNIIYSIFALFIFIIYLWFDYLFIAGKHPLVVSLLAGAIILFLIFKLIKNKKNLLNYKKGTDGEKLVGQYLDEMRDEKTKVFHDLLVPNKFNIDHLVICTKGIYAVETKNYSQKNIAYRNHSLVLSNYTNTKILKQISAQKIFLENLIKTKINFNYPVTPILIFPEHFIEKNNFYEAKKDGFWILNEKVISIFIQNEPEMYTLEEVEKLSSIIKNNLQ
jgi:hypothetical protein